MTDCCDNFATTITMADREANPIWRAHDDCGYKAQYKGLVGTDYPAFMPVKFGATPGTVEPAPDGVDAIGFISSGAVPVVAGAENLTVVQFAAEVAWADVAVAVGASPTDQAAWWAMAANLANVVKTLKF